MSNHSLNHAIRKTREKLQNQGISEANLDTKLLVEWVTSTSTIDRILQPDMCLSSQQIAQLEEAIKRRISGEPTHRIIGTREFYGISFALSKETLEPRPDTEILIDLVLPILKKKVKKSGKATLLDMGTGTGAIAIAILKQVVQTCAVAVDIAEDALKTATQNAKNADVLHRFTPLLSNWFNTVTGQFDLIISNPPYIPEKDIPNLAKEVRQYDPLRALIGGKDGLDFYRKLADESATYLKEEGYIAVEIGYSQKKEVCNLFEKNGFKCLKIRDDLSGIPRAILFSLNT
ncbi:protein-(glutamine-N5) methyltransferase, release factor-specific [Bartonella bacilliformis str. Heidi Mejia]|uniref:Release factor glutamine methyltransferase n=2 Tax=Bartonella bacilliformis TaxID=774 RepID=A1URS4_BARBK|nr:peptide chain release factor N(5)-glutamine methyltransferase [Bartonella bacilliformis]ABM44772.1 methyltransferase, HemK family [Bartonella bacilliformis KC583]AMG85522.1 peptide chain release factor N(5)-glutamine methyltransferase [Bartonella bacilliformis]EKS45794.1 N5-glutamine S-adenosyl-L-methionine-dependent methyltransferase [Bartonella bacilliformis INS]EYS90188.1 protein-(glutamine-N5) methyltransferase, release factor-specific [Bartonella bacilliformis San Pedro600-02]EYS92352.